MLLLYLFNFNLILFVHKSHANFGFVDVQYLQNNVFSFEKGFNTQWKNSCPYHNSHPPPPNGKGDFFPTPLMVFGNLENPGVIHLSKTRYRNNFQIFLVWQWTETQFNTPKNEISLKFLLVIRNWFWISTWKYRIWISKNASILRITAWKGCWLLFYPKLCVGVSLCFT